MANYFVDFFPLPNKGARTFLQFVHRQYASKVRHILDSFKVIEQTEVQSNIRNIRCVSEIQAPSARTKKKLFLQCVFLLTFLLVFYFIFAADSVVAGAVVVVFTLHSSENNTHVPIARKYTLIYTCVQCSYWRWVCIHGKPENK